MALAGEGAIGCATGSQTCTGKMPALHAAPITHQSYSQAELVHPEGDFDGGNLPGDQHEFDNLATEDGRSHCRDGQKRPHTGGDGEDVSRLFGLSPDIVHHNAQQHRCQHCNDR